MIKLIEKYTVAENRPNKIVEVWQRWKEKSSYNLITCGVDSVCVAWINKEAHIYWTELSRIIVFCQEVMPIVPTWAAIRESDNRLCIVFRHQLSNIMDTKLIDLRSSTIIILILKTFFEIYYPNLEIVRLKASKRGVVYLELADRTSPPEAVDPEHEFFVRQIIAKGTRFSPSNCTIIKKETENEQD